MSEHTIPPIIDPMGKHWDQPPTSAILIDDKHAVMTDATFKSLCEYSGTIPTGVYAGKMWRRFHGKHDPRCRPEDRKWFLFWYGYCDDPNQCSINGREILIA